MTSQQISVRDKYDILRNVGHGPFGVVSKIKIKETGKIFALKQIDFSKYDAATHKELLIEAQREFNVLNKGLTNVVPSIGSHYNENEKGFDFSIEFFPQNLYQLVEERLEKENKENMSWEEYLPLFQNIITGNFIQEGCFL